jgi:hypothetical protein
MLATPREIVILGQRDIVEEDIEFPGSGGQLVTNKSGDESTLSNQLTRIKLCDHRLENLIDNGGENPFVVVCSKSTVDGREFFDSWTREHTTCDVDHL